MWKVSLCTHIRTLRRLMWWVPLQRIFIWFIAFNLAKWLGRELRWGSNISGQLVKPHLTVAMGTIWGVKLCADGRTSEGKSMTKFSDVIKRKQLIFSSRANDEQWAVGAKFFIAAQTSREFFITHENETKWALIFMPAGCTNTHTAVPHLPYSRAIREWALIMLWQ